MEQIRARRPLIRGWIESARVLGREGRFFLLGFPPEQKTAMESLGLPRNRDFLESLLKEVSGHDWNVKLSLKEGLVTESAEPEPATRAPEAKPRASSFKDDPLIRDALEIFKGEIKPVTD
jgi:hypothetical protein